MARTGPGARRRRLGGLLGLGVVAAALWVWSGAEPSGAQGLRFSQLERRSPEPGLELVTARLVDGRGGRGRLVALFLDLARFSVGLRMNPEAAPLEALRGDALAIANAGYFTEARQPTGLLVSDHERLHRFVRSAGGAGSGVLTVQGGRVRLLERDALRAEDVEGVEMAIQAGPRLIEADGRPGIRSDDGQRANRTAIGRDGHGRFVLAVTYADDGGFARGLTLFELQDILRNQLVRFDPRLGLEVALNLDGGPSTGLHVEAPRIDLPASSRVVSTLVVDRR